MRSCTDNIARLEASLAPGQPGTQNLNPHGLAHRHGVVRPLMVLQGMLHMLNRSLRHIVSSGKTSSRYLDTGQCVPADGNKHRPKRSYLFMLYETSLSAELLQALILSERLQAVGTIFDRCRSVRYQQLLQQQRQLQQKKHRLNAIQVS